MKKGKQLAGKRYKSSLTPMAVSGKKRKRPSGKKWGPTDNVSFCFACGDTLRPGTLYWSKGNNPDSAPQTNQQDSLKAKR